MDHIGLPGELYDPPTPDWYGDHVAPHDFRVTPRLKSEPTVKPQAIQPAAADERSKNPLRPTRFEDVIGQVKAKRLLARMTEVAKRRGEPLSHVLLIGPSGTGKTTFAHVIATELQRKVYQLEAPVSLDALLELREVMEPGDILFIDEIHQQAIQERRGKSASTQPEVLFSIMEDFTVPTRHGVLPFPHITIMGATTDAGMLPEPFIMRFPIKPRLVRYDVEDMTTLAIANAEALGYIITPAAAQIFARASRGTPREVNNYVKNCKELVEPTEIIKPELAFEVLFDLNGVSLDGLTADMQAMLSFLYSRCRRVNGEGTVTYQASVSTIATAIGKSRDQKAIALYVEPYLIELGYIQVGHGGRSLTPAGVERASSLLRED